MNKIKFADLFAGIGGFRVGLERLGWECAYSAEFDEHACKMYEANFHDNPMQDVTSLTDQNINDISDFDVLCAGFPCQSFSISGKKKGFLDETRGTLFFEILRILTIKKPKAFILENVKFLVHHDKGRTFSIMIDSLNALGYSVSYKVLNAKDFGVPQNRERIVIVGNLEGKVFNFDNLVLNPVHSMKEFLDEPNDQMVYLNTKDYTLIPKDMVKRQPSDLVFVGYRNKAMRKNGVRDGTENLSRTHKMPNRIYSSNGVNPTIASQETTGRYFILIDNMVRKITINEAFKFMGFPSTFKKIGPQTKIYNRIGNSVCVNMIESVGSELENMLNSDLDENNPEVFLEKEYKMAEDNGIKYFDELNDSQKDNVLEIVDKDKSNKGVYTVLFSSLTFKILHPDQDVRLHKVEFKGGYSGRSFDTKYVTPFLKQKRFNGAMKESGWLTRSLEQAHPFDLEFPGNISNKKLKQSFLTILDDVETYNYDPEIFLIAIIYKTLEKKSKENVKLINPVKSESKLEISQIMNLLEKHFSYKNYKGGSRGNSILPVIALYSIYEVLVDEMARYDGKKLLTRESHYSSDKSSGETGDIVVINNDKTIYEVVDVKYGIPVNNIMIEDAYNKFKYLKSVQRYYILSTITPDKSTKDSIDDITKKIYKESGTQFIANGLMRTINYYLRLISDTDKFMDNYVHNVQNDSELNAEHKIAWNRINE